MKNILLDSRYDVLSSLCTKSQRSWVQYLVRPHTLVSPAGSRRTVVSFWRKCMHEVLVNRLGGLSLPRKSLVRLTDRLDMTLDVYLGRKTLTQQFCLKDFYYLTVLETPRLSCLSKNLTGQFQWPKLSQKLNTSFRQINLGDFLTLKVPITTTADNIHKYFFSVFQRNKTWWFKWILC